MSTSENPNTPLEVSALDAAKRIAAEMTDEQLDAVVKAQREARAAQAAAEKAARPKVDAEIASTRQALDSYDYDNPNQYRAGFN